MIGLETEGLFRLSGATSEVIQLQKAFEHQGYHQLIDLTGYDIHSITSFIKKYLHHLPNAVIPLENHDDFLRLVTLSKDQAIPLLIDLIATLPHPHRHLFHAILTLASHIQHYAHINMMNPEALAVVLAPVCTGIEKTIQILPKKPSKRNKKQDQEQQHTHPYRQCINTLDIEQFIRTNTHWTLLWKWMIEECHVILFSTRNTYGGTTTTSSSTTTTTSTSVSSPSAESMCYQPFNKDSTWSIHLLDDTHKDTITSIVGSPAPPPPVPSLLYWSSSLAAAAAKQEEATSGITTKTPSTHHYPTSPTLYGTNQHLLTSSASSASLSSDYHRNNQQSSHNVYPRRSPSKIDLKSKQSMLSLCQKSSHGLLRRLASVSSLR
ncbi:Rho GTPase activation protein [Chlamydoabsidia padenii]|nr:Rho GTPase activation protein [Chlamydoabsidia padenii]